jgi:type IV secretion system protein VirB11
MEKDSAPISGSKAREGGGSDDGIESSALTLTMQTLRPYLRPDVTELCINRPGELFLETRGGWERHPDPAIDFLWCYRLAKLVANSTKQRVTEEAPLLSAALPTGERVQIAIPPATSAGCVALTFRRPAEQVWSLCELATSGIFGGTRRSSDSHDATELELLKFLSDQNYQAFLSAAVRARKNIVVSGQTGSGKTTLTKALIKTIPEHERLITIEDAQELVLDNHPNHVRLYYSKGNQGRSLVTPRQLLESCLRMRPDRILLAELRSDEAFDYLRNVNSGHPGSITSVHASSAELAFEQLSLLVKQSDAGRDLSRQDIQHLLYMLVDVVVQLSVVSHRRMVSEIWYEPSSKRTLADGRGRNQADRADSASA